MNGTDVFVVAPSIWVRLAYNETVKNSTEINAQELANGVKPNPDGTVGVSLSEMRVMYWSYVMMVCTMVRHRPLVKVHVSLQGDDANAGTHSLVNFKPCV